MVSEGHKWVNARQVSRELGGGCKAEVTEGHERGMSLGVSKDDQIVGGIDNPRYSDGRAI